MEAQQAVEYLKDEAGDDVNVIFGTVNADFGDQISATIIATGIKSSDAAGNSRTGFTKKTNPAPAFSGQPIHNGKVMTQQQAESAAAAEVPDPVIEEEDQKITIPEFLLKSRRR